MDVEPVLLAEPSAEDADSLVSSNDPDDMANEQTWPTEEEMRGLDGVDETSQLPEAENGTTPKAVKRIPKGMSEYQAAWIVDGSDDENEDEDAEGKLGEDEEMDPMEQEEMIDMPVFDQNNEEAASRKSVAFQDLDVEEDERQ